MLVQSNNGECFKVKHEFSVQFSTNTGQQTDAAKEGTNKDLNKISPPQHWVQSFTSAAQIQSMSGHRGPQAHRADAIEVQHNRTSGNATATRQATATWYKPHAICHS
jgi:hypothetical protein